MFTDLDGCLLDHDTYAFEQALPVLSRLKALAIPVIFTSSKTAAELHELQKQIGVFDPFISENGGAVWLPNDWLGVAAAGELVTFTANRTSALEILHQYADQFQFRSFSDLGVEGVREHTGLDAASARRALDRQCTQPLLWQDTPEALERLRELLVPHDLTLTAGGRFVHAAPPVCKADGMRFICERMRAHQHDPGTTIAIGDSPIDLQMLECADLAIVQPQPDGRFAIRPTNPRCIEAVQSGPDGWASAVSSALASLGL